MNANTQALIEEYAAEMQSGRTSEQSATGGAGEPIAANAPIALPALLVADPVDTLVPSPLPPDPPAPAFDPSAPVAVAVDSEADLLRVHFYRFDLTTYDLFLKIKRLPESNLTFHPSTATYSVTAPSRFAAMLGVELPGTNLGKLPLSSFLFDDQAAIVRMALAAKRFACWSDCGLGKTLIELEFARQVMHRTGGRVLIFTLNEIVPQFLEMAKEFYGDSLPIHRITSREEMRQWCVGKSEWKHVGHGGEAKPDLAITNYEKMNHKGAADQVVSEIRYLAGVVLDESSRLKAGGGKQKWALIKSCKGIEYKLSCTATPAPNDTIEFASQASFLEKMRSDGEIIWTYFHRETKKRSNLGGPRRSGKAKKSPGKWVVKKHAKEAFYQFMAAWSIYVRDPRRYGWRQGHKDVPAPIVKQHIIEATAEQVAVMQRICTEKDGQMSLLDAKSVGAVQRSKLSQAAKGFIYLNGESRGQIERIESGKPAFVADLCREELAAGLQVLVWTVFNAESDILSEELLKLNVHHDLLTGKTKDAERLAVLERFRKGQSQCLVSRASMLGYGMNFQCCGAMIFSGYSDSYESYYQAVRRAYRYGQGKHVHVHIPVVQILEGDMLENLYAKQAKHEAAIAEMQRQYIEATKKLRSVR